MKKIFKIWFLLLLITIFLSSCSNSENEENITISSENEINQDISTNNKSELDKWNTAEEIESIFSFEELEFDFWILKQSGGIVTHDFKFTYNGKVPISVTWVPWSCLCTSAEISKNTFLPGESWILTVIFNPNMHGEPEWRFFKTVTILTEPQIENMPEIKVWQEIDLDLWEEAFELNTIMNNWKVKIVEHIDKIPHWEWEEKESNKIIEKIEIDKNIITKNSKIIPELESITEIANNGIVPKLEKIKSWEIRKLELTAYEVIAPLSDKMSYNYWTYDKKVPGPFMRVVEWDTIEFTLKNDVKNRNKHSIDLHAVNWPGWWWNATQVYPGQEKTFKFKALNPWIYIYHCATNVVSEHVANWMYWLIFVEPKEWLSKVDREFVVVQGEFYTILERWKEWTTQLSSKKLINETPEYITFNGRVWALTDKRSLKAKKWEKIRIFAWNWWVSKISSFHVIWEIFDTVYLEWGTTKSNNIQTTVIPAWGATIVEFTIDVPWKYKIVDHALARTLKWAIAEIEVTWEENSEIFDK